MHLAQDRTLSTHYNRKGEKIQITFFPDRGSNPVRRIQSPALYHVAIKAGFYRKVVEVYHIPNCYIPPSYNETFVCIHANTNVAQAPSDNPALASPIRLQGCHPHTGHQMERRKNPNHIFPRPGIEPGPPDSKSSTLPRRYKSRLLPQGSRSVSYT